MSVYLKRLAALAAALTVAVSFPAAPILPMQTAAASGNMIVERLDRGITAINTGSGMLVSWRFLADDADDAVFRLYRDNELIYTSGAGEATCYLDQGGSAASTYKVETDSYGKTTTDVCTLRSDTNYFNIPLDIPQGGSDYTYSANDCSVGDVDGDGVYEVFVKWDPSNSKDNSQSGVTGNVYIDCYTLTGQKLWRIDLGRNIRAGAHYTQFLVADFDCDGYAEMTCKTADGTVDGTGKVIGDPSKDYRNSGGYILDGPEYYTLFDGATGAALDTVDYEYPRGEVSKKTWGDDYGNRCDRFLGAVVYLDGIHPSAVSIRGYYTRMTAVAYDVVDKKLVKRWGYDTGYNSSAPGYSDGNHNCMAADVDGDGKQELVLGATCLDDNGNVLWCNEMGHGDAMHLSDFLPDRPGQELWVCHEHEPYGVSLLDAKDGSIIFHYDHAKDTGRCAAGNILASNPGAEFWGAQSGSIYNGTGETVSTVRPAQNFLIWWDGDLERELQDGTWITKMRDASTIDTIFTADGCASNNSTKSNPGLTADILGDWREETIYRTEDSRYLRIFCTPSPTQYRITTLAHDPQYRTQVAGEQNCYNQPAHTSFYLGSDQPLPARPAVTVNDALKPAEPVNGKLIENLIITDKANRLAWGISPETSVGTTMFGDRDFTYTAMSEELAGLEGIYTACDSKYQTIDLANFTASEDLTVYVLMDTRVDPLPEWLNGWEKTALTAHSSNDVDLIAYSKDFDKGDLVTLGQNGQSAYCVNYTVLLKERIVKVKGDVTMDGVFDLADIVAMQRWLLHDGTVLADPSAAEYTGDEVLDVFDLALMKRDYLN